jgi:hypothetical protein
MHRHRIPVVAVCLAALALAPVPATGSPQQPAPKESPRKPQGESSGNGHCGDHGQGPPPHAQGEPNRKSAEPKSRSCSDGGDAGPADPDPSPHEDDNMKFTQAMAVAALATTVAGGASAAEIGFLAKDCRTSSGSPDVHTDPYYTPSYTTQPQSTPGASVEEGKFCLGLGSLGRVCSPAAAVPSQEVPSQTVPGQTVPGQDVEGTPGDQYCQLLTFVGAGTMSVLPYGATCQSGQQGITIDRSGQGVWTFRVTKNGETLFERSIETPGGDPSVSPFPIEFCAG